MEHPIKRLLLLRIKIITETISANPALDKNFNWLLQGGNHVVVHHGGCANSVGFSCLQSQYRTQLDFIREHHERRTIKFQFARHENCLEALTAFKKKCGSIFKRSLVSRFRTKENVFWNKFGSVLKAKRSYTGLKVTMYYDYDPRCPERS